MNVSSNPSTDPKDAEGVLRMLPSIALFVAVALVIGYAVAFHALPIDTDPAAWGQFGDYMGGLLNPLISLFTLMIAVRVWFLQKTEMLETRKAVAEQGRTAEQQRQEQRFFDLLNVYYRTVDSIRYTRRQIGPFAKEPENFEGKAAVSAWLSSSRMLQEFLEDRGTAIPGKGYDPDSGEIGHMDRMIVEWNDGHAREYFDSYFRVVRHLLSEAEGLLGDQHVRYVELFCAQLSRTETILLAFHLWLDPEGQDVQHLAGQYRLLRNLPKGDLRIELENDLPPEIFGLTHSIGMRK